MRRPYPIPGLAPHAAITTKPSTLSWAFLVCLVMTMVRLSIRAGKPVNAMGVVCAICGSVVGLGGLLLSACATAPTVGQSAPKDAKTAEDAVAAGWVEMIGDRGLDGWSAMNGANPGAWFAAGEAMLDLRDPRKLASGPGRGVLINGDGKTKNLFSRREHGDAEIHIEFLVAKGSNSGVYLQSRYELQILDSYGVSELTFSDCGGLYQRYDEAAKRGWDGRAPKVNASKPAGQWQSFDILFRAPKFAASGEKIANAKLEWVKLNGVIVQENTELSGPTRNPAWPEEVKRGPLRLQADHGPVAYRNVRLREL